MTSLFSGQIRCKKAEASSGGGLHKYQWSHEQRKIEPDFKFQDNSSIFPKNELLNMLVCLMESLIKNQEFSDFFSLTESAHLADSV